MRLYRLLFTALYAALALNPVAALAHAKLAKSVPGNGETAKAGLEQVTLGFSKSVRVTLVKVRRMDSDAVIPIVRKPKPAFAQSHALEVAPLAPGQYAIDWTAVAKDGHVMTGKHAFTIEP